MNDSPRIRVMLKKHQDELSGLLRDVSKAISGVDAVLEESGHYVVTDLTARMRRMLVHESIVVECRSDTDAASVRGNAYRIMGMGCAKTKRLSPERVLVTRIG